MFDTVIKTREFDLVPSWYGKSKPDRSMTLGLNGA